MEHVWIDPEALATAASYVVREWGYVGYTVTGVAQGVGASAILRVAARDGSVFYVGATRYGFRCHADTQEELNPVLAAAVLEESKP